MSLDQAVYLIEGRKYTFEGIRFKDGYRYGYCPRRKKYAYLFDKYVQFINESPVEAERIE